MSVNMQRHLRDSKGNTVLHKVIKMAGNYADLLSTLKQMNPAYLRKTSCQYNLNGELPINVMQAIVDENNDVEVRAEDEVFHLLFNAMACDVEPLNKALDWESIKSEYQLKPGSQYHDEMKIACEIVNQVREINLASCTHPQLNGCPVSVMDEIEANIDKDRRVADRILYKLILDRKDIHFMTSIGHRSIELDASLSADEYEDLLETQARVFMQNRRADCGEFSTLIQYLLFKAGYQSDVVHIDNGDHSIVVLGRDPNSSTSDYKEWTNAIVIDAWEGSIYPASEIEKKLKNFEYFIRDNRNYACVVPFDPYYHELSVENYIQKKLHSRISLHPSKVTDQFLLEFKDDLSAREMYIFHEYIMPKLQKLIDDRTITLDELTALHSPRETLMHIFLEPEILDLIINKSHSLADIEYQKMNRFKFFELPRVANNFNATYSNERCSFF